MLSFFLSSPMDSEKNVASKAISTKPYIGYIGYFVRTPKGFILVIIPATLPARA